ncbi:MAG: glycosyltransferase family 9 protein [Planctomycetota bacterium]
MIAASPELCRELVQLSAAGEGTLVLSGPAEAELGRQFEQQFQADPAVRHWVGQRGVPQLCALFAAAAEAGLVLVASDSGPCHLATACDLPTRILFGRTRPERNGPWPLPGPGSPHRTLLAPGGDLRRLAADEVHAWIAQDARP